MKKRDYIDFDRWVWISLTQKCQWKCWYCDHPKINNPQTVSLDYFNEFCDIFRRVKKKSNIEVSFEGGEIGLLDTGILDAVFESNLSNTYTITTNGLFMKKGYHDKYKEKIHHILYHVVPDMNNESLDFPKYDFDRSIHVLYTIVVHKNNIQYLSEFLDYNKDYMFLPHFLQPRTDNLCFMNKQDFQNIYNIIKNKQNIEDHMKNRVLEIINNFNKPSIKTFRKLCCNIYNKPIFNLPRKLIHRCCISMNTSPVSINEHTIHGTLYNKLGTFPMIDPTCEQCIANFVWMYQSHYMNKNTELNNRSISFDILKRMAN